MILFVSGAITFSFVVASIFFLKFWRKSSDLLHLCLGLAFGLFALNQIASDMISPDNAKGGFTFILRALGYLIILAAIFVKNLAQKSNSSNGKRA
jgi:succinate dehydrogenase hydrophobic anchor subunit